jgi:DNA-binding CsgD family transcriptional regulator
LGLEREAGMDRLRQIDHYLERICKAGDRRSLFAAVAQEVERLGFERYAYTLTALPSGGRPQPRIVNTNYPAAWSERYVDERYEADDLVCHQMALTSRPFTWREANARPQLTSTQQLVVNEARDFGLTAGGAVGLSGPGCARARFAIGSSMSPDEFEKLFMEHRLEVHLVGLYAHERMIELLEANDPAYRVRLTPKEIEVLTWTARGKTSGEAATILSLSEPTIKEHLGNACRKFGVNNRTHAVSLALKQGLIAP